MSIWICSLDAAPQLVRKLRPARVVSLLSPYDTFPVFDGLAADLHLQVPIHDITADVGDWRAPESSDAERVIRPAPIVAALATSVQTTRETASRAISLLERRGIIARQNDHWLIQSIRLLEDLIV